MTRRAIVAVLAASALTFLAAWPAAAQRLDFCHHAEEIEGVGKLCAVRPSAVDPATDDAYPGGNPACVRGYGYHLIGFPERWWNPAGVLIQFIGTSGRPYDQDDPGDPYRSLPVVLEGMAQGYLVIELAYSNACSVNEDTCQTEAGKALDNCAGLVRTEILEGVDTNELADVDFVNGVDHRLSSLLLHLESNRIPLPSAVSGGVVDWSSLRVGGHSQGAGHAYFVAKNRGVARACLLGGPFDVPDWADGPPAQPWIADWYLEPGSATAVDRIRAAVSGLDTSIDAFETAYEVIGLERGLHWDRVERDYGTGNGHKDIHLAPELAWIRTLACFTNDLEDELVAPVENLDLEAICAADPDAVIAEYLAADPLGAQQIRDGVYADMCDYWSNGADQASAEVCLFDEARYRQRYPGYVVVIPYGGIYLPARFHFERVGFEQGKEATCVDRANTRRAALGF